MQRILLSAVAVISTFAFANPAYAENCPAATLLETPAEVSKFLAQAGLGANEQDLKHFNDGGWVGRNAAEWVEDQFQDYTKPGFRYREFTRSWDEKNNQGAGSDWFTRPRAHRFNFWNILLDQDSRKSALRHRTAFALSQILVVSDRGATWHHIPYYQDQLFRNSFEDYKQVLTSVTFRQLWPIICLT